jgi:phosphomannomutase
VILVFDVDGTLTPARQKIDKEFALFFADFCKQHKVCLVTGSDKQKTVEQISSDIFNCSTVFNCLGNEIWNHNELLYEYKWIPSTELLVYLNKLIETSSFAFKNGSYFEYRTGMLNVAVPGRPCSTQVRQLYKQFDAQNDERKCFRELILEHFNNIDVYIGGETGLDIVSKGRGKDSAVKLIKAISSDKIMYFGDQLFVGGNDYPVIGIADKVINISSWEDTFNYLKDRNFME